MGVLLSADEVSRAEVEGTGPRGKEDPSGAVRLFGLGMEVWVGTLRDRAKTRLVSSVCDIGNATGCYDLRKWEQEWDAAEPHWGRLGQ